MRLESPLRIVEQDPPAEPLCRRAAWRQRLIDAERGFVRCFRSDSTFFVHFFGGIIVVAAGLVLGLGTLQWGLVGVCLTAVLSAGMFHQALRTLAEANPDPSSSAPQDAVAMGTAAVTIMIAGACLVVGLVFCERVSEMFPDSSAERPVTYMSRR